ncbi:MFS transporter [Micrococcus sp. FDAARGOS_333]|uniref:MFS transporter n=1 Tax=Micrococcus sp. FDAARGOS_333 TaxID=1930558 RepID=UPI00187D4E36|nr:MFS transporter [Micrococcus sp. FDAARGOS_333]
MDPSRDGSHQDAEGTERWAPGQAGYRRLLFGLFLAGIATFAQLYSPQGLLPLVAADLQVTSHEAALLVSAATAGLALSVIPWSFASDRWGRRRAIAVSMVSACVFAVAGALATAFPLLLALRFAEGLAHGGVAALAVALIVEEVESFAVTLAAGTYIAGTTLGGLSGRLMAAPIGEAAGWHAGMLTVTGVGVLCVIGFLLVTPQARHFVRRPTPLSGVVAAAVENLRSPVLCAVYLQGALLMGGFVALYNYVGFAVTAEPLSWPLSVVALLFLAYLAGTWTSPWAGSLALRFGRYRVLTGASLVMAAGALLTIVQSPFTLIPGLLLFTGAFFAAHSVASSWAGLAARGGRAQSTSLYNLGYYGGSSLFGWLAGVVFEAAGWAATVLGIVGLVLCATAVATLVLRRAAHAD